MFCQLKKMFMCDRKNAKCPTKADAHDKMVFSISQLVYTMSGPMRGSRGETGGPDPPPEKSQNY